jgi:ribosomal protein S28E/S33
MSATIEQIRSLASPLKGYQFLISIINPPGTGASIQEMQFRCISSVMPGRTVDAVVTSLGSYDVSDPGRMSGGKTWTTTFIEGTDTQIIQRLNSWQELCFNPRTGVQGSRSDIKRTARIELLEQDRSISFTRNLIGLWPTEIGDISLDNSSSEGVTIDCTWAYDYFETI